MKKILLTYNQVALVDDDDYEYLSKWRWSARWSERVRNYYALRYENGGKSVIFMHREIMKTPKGLITDHANHNTLDNRKENLRICNYFQNGMNRKASIHNELGEKNIRRHGSGFEVKIIKNGKIVFDKTFRSIEDAIIARDSATEKYHGEFGYKHE